ncbi:hypothetical protein PoB_002442100 [Plakobranchus ocellatus]|uniref:Integrase catalytic domain-containing protein n=1 Tax=Plakobranchus ocellatus TaxID=259542 RepID=A0AAV3ZTS3_9GAST|nr:hypothetical protein PoB_002442100 [Plakobranchus ocellatus]
MSVAHDSISEAHLGIRRTKDKVLSNFYWPGVDGDVTSEAGHGFILTLVDYATRFAEAVPSRKIDTESVAEALVDIYSRLSVPEEVLSDQGTQFISDCMKEVFRLSNRKPQPRTTVCNGLVERFNATLKTCLRRLFSQKPRQWHRYINPLLLAYREMP